MMEASALTKVFQLSLSTTIYLKGLHICLYRNKGCTALKYTVKYLKKLKISSRSKESCLILGKQSLKEHFVRATLGSIQGNGYRLYLQKGGDQLQNITVVNL